MKPKEFHWQEEQVWGGGSINQKIAWKTKGPILPTAPYPYADKKVFSLFLTCLFPCSVIFGKNFFGTKEGLLPKFFLFLLHLLVSLSRQSVYFFSVALWWSLPPSRGGLVRKKVYLHCTWLYTLNLLIPNPHSPLKIQSSVIQPFNVTSQAASADPLLPLAKICHNDGATKLHLKRRKKVIFQTF